ncbi:MAG: WD40 repeat domain-containing protein [Gemmataceae bacterium]
MPWAWLGLAWVGVGLMSSPAGAQLPSPPLPPGAIARHGDDRFRFYGGTSDFYISPDEKCLINIGQHLTVFEANSGRIRHLLRGYRNFDTGRFVDAETFVFVGSGLDTNYYFGRMNIRTGVLAFARELKFNYTGAPAISPDGQFIAAVVNNELYCYDTMKGRVISKVRLPELGNSRMDFSPDGTKLMVALGRDTVYLDRVSGAIVERYTSTTTEQTSFSPNGKFGITRSGNDVYMLDPATGHRGDKIEVGERGVERALVHDDGNIILYRIDRIRVLDRKTKQVLRNMATPGSTMNVLMAPGGQTLWANTLDGCILGWDYQKGERLPISADPPENIQFLRYLNPTTLRGYSGIEHFLLDLSTGKKTFLHRRAKSEDMYARTLDGQHEAISDDSGLSIFHRPTNTLLYKNPWPTGDKTLRMIFSDDGQHLFALAGEQLLQWHLPTGRHSRHENLPLGPNPTDISPTYDGRVIAIGSRAPDAGDLNRARLLLWKTDTRKPEKIIDFSGVNGPDAIAWNKSEDRIAISFVDRTSDNSNRTFFGVVDRSSGTMFQRGGSTDTISNNTVYFSPDGRTVLMNTYSNETRFYEAITGQIRHSIQHCEYTWPDALAFNADGTRLISSAGAVPILEWDIRQRTRAVPAFEADKLWAALSGGDAAAAYQAILTYERHPDRAVAELRRRVRMEPKPAAADVQKWFGELLAADYATRRLAQQQLDRHSDSLQPELTTLLQKTPSMEVRDVVDRILSSQQGTSPLRVTQARAVEVLEHLALPAAEALLKEWSHGPAAAFLTREAHLALTRRALLRSGR